MREQREGGAYPGASARQAGLWPGRCEGQMDLPRVGQLRRQKLPSSRLESKMP
ncbi:MAG TPA: hypothetical protein PKE49_15910 [Leptospiraceae bacterium]|nr:hypothetical protein [Leptospirales bacterium]HMU81987.1 hypothetical protein [Leptospiraceae bacterium]HMX58008.1 hypothetical protein [Leptospiraceae bacterium]HNL00324.1 hypothetical protein [Leptospiraceae bacterium]HNN60037.1 hypothetical protein [Leptospiraceae bacterium]